MRNRRIVGLIVVVGVLAAGWASTMAQRPRAFALNLAQGEPDGPPKIRPTAKIEEPKGEAVDLAVPLPDQPPTPGEVSKVAVDDPMAAVDAFLTRNRKEADDSIQALSREAEALRARLQKVEAALARWQGVAGALQEGQPGGPELGGPPPAGPASGPKLDGKKVLVLSSHATPEVGVGPVDLPRELSREVARLLRQEVRTVRIVEPAQVAEWVAHHPSENVAFEAAKALEADLVIFLEVAKFATEDPTTPDLLRGVSSVSVQVWELTAPSSNRGWRIKGQPRQPSKLVEYQVDSTFPVRGPVPKDSGISSSSFRTKFLGVVAREISANFASHPAVVEIPSPASVAPPAFPTRSKSRQARSNRSRSRTTGYAGPGSRPKSQSPCPSRPRRRSGPSRNCGPSPRQDEAQAKARGPGSATSAVRMDAGSRDPARLRSRGARERWPRT